MALKFSDEILRGVTSTQRTRWETDNDLAWGCHSNL
jgi:hypothetical protein